MRLAGRRDTKPPPLNVAQLSLFPGLPPSVPNPAGHPPDRIERGPHGAARASRRLFPEERGLGRAGRRAGRPRRRGPAAAAAPVRPGGPAERALRLDPGRGRERGLPARVLPLARPRRRLGRHRGRRPPGSLPSGSRSSAAPTATSRIPSRDSAIEDRRPGKGFPWKH